MQWRVSSTHVGHDMRLEKVAAFLLEHVWIRDRGGDINLVRWEDNTSECLGNALQEDSHLLSGKTPDDG